MFGEMVAGSDVGRSGFSAVCARGGASLPVAATCTRSTVVVFPARWTVGRNRYTPGVCWSATRATEEMVEDKGSKYGTHVPRTTTVLANLVVDAMGRSTSFLNARTEQEIISCIRKGMESGTLPENVAFGMEELYYNYQNAVMQGGDPLAKDVILTNMAIVLDLILLDMEDPFTFSAYHRAVRIPFDYYLFGQNYIRPLIDFRRSYVGNISLFYEIEEKLHQGHNVVLVSNHQTEADPAFIALLLETTNPHVAEELTYVAGDRVITDPLCKPFSMGRNLICVYSKKHLYDIPEIVEMKKKANTRSLKAMALLLREGGKIIWIAPSGGRDRPDPVTGEWHPAPFDASSVDNIRRLADHSSLQGHVYPLALLSHDVMPPPPQVEKQIGERRSVAFHGIGLSIGPEVNFENFASSSSEEARVSYSQALYGSVTEQYNVLKSAIYEHKGLNASNNFVSLSQPWK